MLRISITQKIHTNKRVNASEIFIFNPFDINPNMTKNIVKVFLNIEKILPKMDF